MSELSQNTNIKLTVKDFAGLAMIVASVTGVYFSLKAEIVEAKELPKPAVTVQEFQYKDELVRKTILLTQQDVEVVKGDIQEIKESLKLLEERLYELR
jgi:hypothetical protein